MQVVFLIFVIIFYVVFVILYILANVLNDLMHLFYVVHRQHLMHVMVLIYDIQNFFAKYFKCILFVYVTNCYVFALHCLIFKNVLTQLLYELWTLLEHLIWVQSFLSFVLALIWLQFALKYATTRIIAWFR